MIFWDLDGVIRDISKATFGYHIPTWDHRDALGKNLVQKVNDNIHILVSAPPTEYKDMIENAYSILDEPIHILTVQPRRWQAYTKLWILNLLRNVEAKITMFQNVSDKYKYFAAIEDALLVEDHPCLPSYKRVVLVRRPWNSSVNHAHKVINNVSDMHFFLTKEVLGVKEEKED